MKRAVVATMSASPNVKLSSALRAVTARVRIQRALEAWVLLAAAVCAALIARALLGNTGRELSALIWTLAGIVPLAGAALWALRPVPILPVARAIDRAIDAPDLVASAVSFAALPSGEQTPFMQICVAQAEQASAQLEPSRALGLQRPRALPALCALALWLIGLSHAPSLAPAATLATRAPAQTALDADTAAAFANDLDALKAQPLDPEAAELVAKLNALLEGIAAGTIDRAQALAELRRIEERLQGLLASDPKALEAALEQLGRALAGAPEAKPLEKALSENWPEAAQELKRLSERVAAGKLNAGAEQRLAKSLERAAGERTSAGQKAAIDEAKRELDRLLRKQEEQRGQGGQQERDERLLKRKQRELDQLEREQEQAKAAERELDRLQRELDAASKALNAKDKQAAADKLQNAANELERAARQQQSRNQAGRLAEQLAQLRAEIAQRGAAGQGRQSSSGDPSDSGSPIALSAQRFGRMAQGNPSGGEGQQGAQPGGAGGQPQQGAGEGQQPGEPGSAERLAQLRKGASAGPGGDKTALLEQSGSSNEQGRGDGAGRGGKPQSGPATAGSGQHTDTRIEGEKRGGPSRSEVIFESGQRGFADEGYAKVHDDYVRHAESVLERERIPGGYRYYVRRYFQLIRPRESARDSTPGAAP